MYHWRHFLYPFLSILRQFNAQRSLQNDLSPIITEFYYSLEDELELIVDTVKHWYGETSDTRWRDEWTAGIGWIGDVKRYRGGEGWSSAEAWYHEAVLLSPMNGK